jgi:hypothetical protein
MYGDRPHVPSLLPDTWASRADWSPQARRRFERRLRRARPGERPRYLWLKAIALLDCPDERRRAAGRSMMARLIEEQPGQRLDLSWSHALLGDACEHDGLDEAAEHHYRRCDALETDPNGPYSGCDLRLAELIVRTGRSDAYPEIDALLDRLERLEPRRLRGAGHRYRHSVVRARLCARLGREDEAAAYAVAALELALSLPPRRADGAPSVPATGDAGIVDEMHDLIDEARR